MIFKTLWRNNSKSTDKTSVNIDQIDDFKYKTNIETRFADFDMMGHVNNAVYFTYMEIARSRYWTQAIQWNWEKTGIVIAQAMMDFIKPIFMEDKISMYVRTSRIGKTSFDLEYMLIKIKNGKEIICSKGKTICVAFDYDARTSAPIPEHERNKMTVFEQLSSN